MHTSKPFILIHIRLYGQEAEAFKELARQAFGTRKGAYSFLAALLIREGLERKGKIPPIGEGISYSFIQ